MGGNKRWSEKDIETLNREYGITDLEELSDKLNRSVDAIQWKASSLKISYNKDFNIIKKILELERQLITLNSKIDHLLINFSKINTTKLRKWSEDELKYLKDNYKTKSLVEIGNDLGRTYASVVQKSKRIKDNKNRISTKSLSPDEKKTIDRMKEEGLKPSSISKELGLDYQRVYSYFKKSKPLS